MSKMNFQLICRHKLKKWRQKYQYLSTWKNRLDELSTLFDIRNSLGFVPYPQYGTLLIYVHILLIISLFGSCFQWKLISVPSVRNWQKLFLRCSIIFHKKYSNLIPIFQKKIEKLLKRGCFWGGCNKMKQMYELETLVITH